MEASNLNVKVLPLPQEASTERSDYEMFGGTNPGLPPKNILDSVPDIVLTVPIALLEKINLIDGDSVFIDPPNQKEDEAHELHIDNNNELILTRYTLDNAGEPFDRSMRNITANKVSFNREVKYEQFESKRPLMPWESAEDDYAERKTGLSR